MKKFLDYLDEIGEIGYVQQTTEAVVYANGLPHAKLKEVVVFESGELGRIMALNQNRVEILTFSQKPIVMGTRIARTNHFFEISVGLELLGQMINPLGDSLHYKKPFRKPTTTRIMDTEPSGIINRKRIKEPCQTGVAIVDLILPLGRGQRELIIGDRKTGKTQFLLQTILSQAKQGSICIYAAIGKRKTDLREIEDFFIANQIIDKTVIIASSPSDPSGIIYLTPYSATTLAEYFRDQGHNVLLILDDLSTHAKFYREISLLSKIFPGRDSYPGDIFYTHAKILERAGNFLLSDGKEVSITCLPVAETIQSDLSGYIQTNLMSMTDGHLFFDSDFFAKGRRPAINPFLSVTRVGHQTQSRLLKDINRELNAFLTLFDKMQNFVHFGAELSTTTKSVLATGEKIIFFLNQKPNKILVINLAIILFSLLWAGNWETKTNDQMQLDIDHITKRYFDSKTYAAKIDQMIAKSDSFNALLKLVRTNEL